ncbi:MULTISPECIES: glycosyltransferase family 2 protein [Providencia]|uniref:glycosyltransferase family 2 protein n=1 Tax=Providencia TaxID=586 RepID=UPI000E3D4217|nr:MULTISPECIES: glycosyltransferase family 2 protein [Providencia]RFT08652.1 glycosyltransferase family 2 protein [Providencia rettgeri]
MMNEKFSIIMPVFNSEETVSDSIYSVLNQTYSNFKLYVINDSSTDNSKDIILSFNDERIVYLETPKNSGVAYARNLGIQHCTGKYISFLDSDDLWLPKKLECQLNKLYEGYDVVCSNYITFNNDSDLSLRQSPDIIKYTSMLKSNFIGNLTGTYNTHSIGKVFQKKVGHEDYVMWLEILKKTDEAFCIQEVLAKYRVSNTSLSSNKLKTIKWQWSIYRNELKLSNIKSLYYFSHYILNALKKRR